MNLFMKFYATRECNLVAIGVTISMNSSCRYAETIENALSTVFLSEMLGCTVIICFLEYGVIMVLEKYMKRKSLISVAMHSSFFQEWADHKILSAMTHVVLMNSMFVNVFIIAYIGDCLKQEVPFPTQTVIWQLT